jgi:DNA repair protein RadC
VAAEETGQLSVLAQILRPVIGERSEVVARRLIQRFGSLSTVWSASAQALAEELDEAGSDRRAITALIVAARDLARVAARETVLGEAIDTASVPFRQYLANCLLGRREECVMVLFFTGEGLFIAEDFHVGTRQSTCEMPLRRTVRRAFDLDARRLILAHNHPSGDPTPSAEDIQSTRTFRQVMAALELNLDDHFVVAKGGIFSMSDNGLI